jgi:CheY-like chemotaxis protein/anti-sigma regulatory factor (Ser/Thr protein kinase)
MSTQPKRTVIAVDDDEINLMILNKNVLDAGYDVKSFNSGVAAWEYMLQYPGDLAIALLDKMMPEVSGIDLLKRIKAHETLRHMPVIIQTGDAGVSQMREGLENGAYYYLTKPFHPEILTAILHSAAAECTMREDMLSQMTDGHAKFIGLLSDGEFVLKTHAEARVLAAGISQAATFPEFVALGLMELLSNAIEHGNLEIGYEKKRQSLMDTVWDDELVTRAQTPGLGERLVRVHVDKIASGLHIAVRDEGKGFDWRYYMHDENAPGRFNEPNGRGIAKSMIMLDDVRYNDKGNEVHCNIALPAALM